MSFEVLETTQCKHEQISPGDNIVFLPHTHICQSLGNRHRPFEASLNTPSVIIDLLNSIAHRLGTRDKLIAGITVHGDDFEALSRFQEEISHSQSSFHPLYCFEMFTIPDTWRRDGRISLSNVTNRILTQHLILIPQPSELRTVNGLLSGTKTWSEMLQIQQSIDCLTIVAHPTTKEFYPTSFQTREISLLTEAGIRIDAIELNAKHLASYHDPAKYIQRINEVARILNLPIIGGSDAHYPEGILIPTQKNPSAETLDVNKIADLPFRSASIVINHQGPHSTPYKALRYAIQKAPQSLELCLRQASCEYPLLVFKEVLRGALSYVVKQALIGTRNRGRQKHRPRVTANN